MSSVTLNLGDPAPEFKNLLSVDGKRYSLETFRGYRVLVIVFSCNHCPYVQAYENRMMAIQRDYSHRDVALVAINSNDAKGYPEDSYDEMIKRAKLKRFNFHYLRDEDQSAAKTYGAICTPHVFIFDERRRLKYVGRIDDNKDPMLVKSRDLRNAIESLLSGGTVANPQTKPFGCSIKWA